jgi:hypothetical protein
LKGIEPTSIILPGCILRGDGFHGGFFRPEKAQNKRACCKTKAHVILRELAQEKSVFSLQNAGKGTDISLCSK